jgi:hypothetical protein
VPPKQVWVTLPKDPEDPPARGIWEDDCYIVELSTGEQLWAVFTSGAFIPCDDEGNEIPTAGFSVPMALTNVERVLIRGYAPGFGPECPKAGQRPRIHLVVAQSPSLVRVINESMVKARELLGERFGAAS